MTDSLTNAKAGTRPNGEAKGAGKAAGRPRTQCPVCQKALTAQGMKAHMRYRHPNAGTREAEKPRSIDIDSYKRGLLDGVLGAMGIVTLGRAA